MTQDVQARTGIRKVIVVAALLLATAAAAPRVARVLAVRYPAIAAIEILWKAPR